MFADELGGRDALEGLEAPRIVGVEEVGEDGRLQRIETIIERRQRMPRAIGSWPGRTRHREPDAKILSVFHPKRVRGPPAAMIQS